MDVTKVVAEFFLGRLGFKKFILSCSIVLSFATYGLRNAILASAAKLSSGAELLTTDYVLLFSSLALAILAIYCVLVIVEALYCKVSKAIEERRKKDAVAVRAEAKLQDGFDRTFIHLPTLDKELLYHLLDGSTFKTSKTNVNELVSQGLLEVVNVIYDDYIVSLNAKILDKVQAQYEKEREKALKNFMSSEYYASVIDFLTKKTDLLSIPPFSIEDFFFRGNYGQDECFSRYVGTCKIDEETYLFVEYKLYADTKAAIEKETKVEINSTFVIYMD
tara:strand:+ start:2607 stop:3434 length:828 start_codon:yes stop_codon:yes gene_type:complete